MSRLTDQAYLRTRLAIMSANLMGREGMTPSPLYRWMSWKPPAAWMRSETHQPGARLAAFGAR